MKALPLREAIARLRAPDAPEQFAAATGAALLAVELGGGEDPQDAEAARALATIGVPAVALVRDAAAPVARHWAPHFDTVVASETELACVEATAAAAPLAASVLVALLRHGETRSVEAGLVAESLAYATLQAGPEHAAWLAARRAPSARAVGAAAPLRVERAGSLLRVTFDDPARRNAWSSALRDAVLEALALARLDATIERVVLAGAGPDFCAGGDLAEFGTRPDPATAHAVRMARSAARALAALAPRVEARVHGAAIGAGAELAAFAGRVRATADAWFALPELSMGLVPGAGGSVSLPRRIGRQRTAWLALTGTRLDAETALAWGLVDAIEAPGGAA